MLTRTILVLAFGFPVSGEEATPLVVVASEDRRQFSESDHPYICYLVADLTTARVLSWVLSSTSVQQEIELCQPQLVVPGLWRIDTRNLLWRHSDWRKVLEQHPYGGYSLLVRGDWLVTDLLDAQLSASRHEDGIASYYRLLYGESVPSTESDFLTFWGIDDDEQRARGHIEGLSQVNRRGRRWIENRDRARGYFWLTRDSLVLDTDSDPLERPDGSFRHDGSEIIVGFEKYSSASQARGAVQYYLLTSGNGGVVNEAPVQLVEDATRFRNVPSIRTWGSCLKCHVEGIRPLGTNALVDLSRKYATAVFTEDSAELRRFHFGSLAKEISRNQEDYADGVKMHTGWTATQLRDAVEAVVRGYDASLDLNQAAVELGVKSEVLGDAIRSYGQANPIPAGISMLAAGGKCSRDLFAQQYGFLDGLLKNVRH